MFQTASLEANDRHSSRDPPIGLAQGFQHGCQEDRESHRRQIEDARFLQVRSDQQKLLYRERRNKCKEQERESTPVASAVEADGRITRHSQRECNP